MEEQRDEAISLAARWVSVNARGHHNVRATHKTTFEVTRDEYLTPRGDCIVGVGADRSPEQLPHWFKREARRSGSIVVAILCSGRVCDAVVGEGDPRMTFTDTRRMVFRRSDYVDGSTVMIRASKAARDLRRDLIASLASGNKLRILLSVIGGGRGDEGVMVRQGTQGDG